MKFVPTKVSDAPGEGFEGKFSAIGRDAADRVGTFTTVDAVGVNRSGRRGDDVMEIGIALKLVLLGSGVVVVLFGAVDGRVGIFDDRDFL